MRRLRFFYYTTLNMVHECRGASSESHADVHVDTHQLLRRPVAKPVVLVLKHSGQRLELSSLPISLGRDQRLCPSEAEFCVAHVARLSPVLSTALTRVQPTVGEDVDLSKDSAALSETVGTRGGRRGNSGWKTGRVRRSIVGPQVAGATVLTVGVCVSARGVATASGADASPQAHSKAEAGLCQQLLN